MQPETLKEILNDHIKDVLNEFQQETKSYIQHVFIHHTKDLSISAVHIHTISQEKAKKEYGV
jgi:hypothetical protein